MVEPKRVSEGTLTATPESLLDVLRNDKGFMPAMNQLTSMQYSQIEIDIAKVLEIWKIFPEI